MLHLGLGSSRSWLRPLILAGAVLLATPRFAAALAVTSFSPGGGLPNTPVSIRGTGFTGTSAVQFNGLPASAFVVQSDSLITTSVPSSAATGFIRVFVGAASATSPATFFVGQAPALFGISALGGAPGTPITITGNNFVGISSVTFNGASSGFSVTSSTQIVTSVPAGGSSGPVVVRNPSGAVATPTFWYPPQILSLSPQGGVAGTPITVNGVNLTPASSVQFNGVPASFSVPSATQLIATVPAGATSGPLSITTVAGNTSTPFFVGASPAIGSFQPTGGLAGTVITIAGSGFSGTTGVQVGGTPAAFSVQSDLELLATVPAGAQTGFITVSNPASAAQSSTSFFVGSPAAISGITPSSAPVGATITITGSQFTSASEVQFNGGASAAAFIVQGPASITAVVPPFAQSGAVRVINPAGGLPSATNFNVSPSLTDFAPRSASSTSATGSPVVITGFNLSAVSQVQFNGVATNFTLIDDQHLSTAVPAGATTGPITLVSLLGNAVSLSPFEILQFTVPPRAAHQGWPHWPNVNVTVANSSLQRERILVASDSAGGMFVAWSEFPGTSADVRLQHLDAFGAVVQGWPAGGLAVCDTTGSQLISGMTPDGTGGVFLVWEDRRDASDIDVYAQRVTAAGQRAAGWPRQGRLVAAAASAQRQAALAVDGAGGVFIAWVDERNLNTDIWAQRLTATGAVASGWLADGKPVCTAFEAAGAPSVLRDAVGGVYIAWADAQFGANYPFIQKLTGAGDVASGWPVGGTIIAISPGVGAITLMPGLDDRVLAAWHTGGPRLMSFMPTGARDPNWPQDGLTMASGGNASVSGTPAASDGAGGAYITWSEFSASNDVYATHITSMGTPAPGWGPSGTLLIGLAGQQGPAIAAADGAGGAFIAWTDNRNGTLEVYATRVLPNQSSAPGWPTTGVMVGGGDGSDRGDVRMAPDGRGGAMLGWFSLRNGLSLDVMAQNLTASGRLGNPEPVIGIAADVPNDQGGKVRIRWQPGYLDSLPFVEISSYGVWRQTTAETMTAALASASRRPTAVLQPGEYGTFRTRTDGALITYWEGLGAVPARGQSLYSFVANTLADSVLAQPADEVYMVDAHAQFGPYFWSTGTVAAHSVDNLPPSTPLGFAGVFQGANASLHWHANVERDLAGYRVYRGATAAFVPDASNLIATVTDTAYTAPPGGQRFYKVEALDIHGNRSATATLDLPMTTGVGDGTGITRAEFAAPRPSPARQSAMFMLRLPQATRVEIQIYDASGRLVRDLLKGTVAAGETPLLWDLRDDAGHRVPAGLYFGRANGLGAGEQRQRLVVLK